MTEYFHNFVINRLILDKILMKSVIIDLPQFLDPRGNLSVVQEMKDIPFKIERVHWIYDTPGGGLRDGHAYHRNEELIIALSGSFDVSLYDGRHSERVTLNRAYKGLYVPRFTWRELDNFSTNAVAMIMSSTPYDEKDYIFTLDEYKKLISNEKHN